MAISAFLVTLNTTRSSTAQASVLFSGRRVAASTVRAVKTLRRGQKTLLSVPLFLSKKSKKNSASSKGRAASHSVAVSQCFSVRLSSRLLASATKSSAGTSGHLLVSFTNVSLATVVEWEFIKELDALIDGPFIMSQRDLTMKFRGSRNQRILHLKAGEIVSEE